MIGYRSGVDTIPGHSRAGATRILLAAVLSAILPTATGCAQPAPSPDGREKRVETPSVPTDDRVRVGDSTRTLVHDGEKRSYDLHVPPSYDPKKPIPVVLVLNSSSAQFMVGRLSLA